MHLFYLTLYNVAHTTMWLVVVHDLLGWFRNRTGRSVDDSTRKHKELAWPMGEPQIGRLLSMHFSVVNWRSRSVAKLAY